jgi:hypothetical protein
MIGRKAKQYSVAHTTSARTFVESTREAEYILSNGRAKHRVSKEGPGASTAKASGSTAVVAPSSRSDDADGAGEMSYEAGRYRSRPLIFIVGKQEKRASDHTLSLWDGFASIKAIPKNSRYHFNRNILLSEASSMSLGDALKQLKTVGSWQLAVGSVGGLDRQLPTANCQLPTVFQRRSANETKVDDRNNAICLFVLRLSRSICQSLLPGESLMRFKR